MKPLSQYAILALALGSQIGCSSLSMPPIAGLFGSDSGSVVRVVDSRNSGSAALPKSAASILVGPYADGRKETHPRKIGTGAQFVAGLGGQDILLDQDVAAMVTAAVKASLGDAGFLLGDARAGNALFALSGVVRDLSYDVKARDELSIVVETTLAEVATGKVLWSGSVREKSDRFAGVSGNSKSDIALYLSRQLGVVAAKTTEAISAGLLAARPDLSGLPPGTRAIAGVTVLVAPAAATPAPQAAAQAAVVAPPLPPAAATSGLLLINTRPTRAKVYLDDIYYGLSPLRLELAAGVHAVSILLEGYKKVVEKVSVRRGDSTEIDLSLER